MTTARGPARGKPTESHFPGRGLDQRLAQVVAYSQETISHYVLIDTATDRRAFCPPAYGMKTTGPRKLT